MNETNANEQLSDNDEKWDYRPMVFFQNNLYGETGNFIKELPDDTAFMRIGKVLSAGEQYEPMIYEEGYSNSLPIGSKIYASDTYDDIYISIDHPSKGLGYILFEMMEDENKAPDLAAIHITSEMDASIYDELDEWQKNITYLQGNMQGEWYGNIFLADSNKDGKYEVLYNHSLGSGIVNDAVSCYNPITKETAELSERMKRDFLFFIYDEEIFLLVSDWNQRKDGRIYKPQLEDNEIIYSGISDELNFEILGMIFGENPQIDIGLTKYFYEPTEPANVEEPVPVGNLYTSGDGEFSEEKEKNANIVVMVSNQSFYVPKAKMSGTVNGLHLFDEVYGVGNQHEYSYYYVYASPGKYKFDILAETASLEETVMVSEDATLWIYLCYWNSETEDETITFIKQNEPILLD